MVKREEKYKKQGKYNNLNHKYLLNKVPFIKQEQLKTKPTKTLILKLRYF